jgi:hypothetical protein
MATPRKPASELSDRHRLWRARRDGTCDPEFRAPGKARQERIDLGLAIFECIALPGQAYSCEEIAAWAGVSFDTIHMYERQALKKLRTRLRIMKDPRLVEMMAELFERRSPAAKKVLA